MAARERSEAEFEDAKRRYEELRLAAAEELRKRVTVTYQPVGKYLLVEQIPESERVIDHGKVLAVGPDVSAWVVGSRVTAGHVVAYLHSVAVSGFHVLVHEDSIVAVVTEVP